MPGISQSQCEDRAFKLNEVVRVGPKSSMTASTQRIDLLRVHQQGAICMPIREAREETRPALPLIWDFSLQILKKLTPVV